MSADRNRLFEALPGGPRNEDRRSGEVWQYMGDEGARGHCFRHRMDPRKGGARHYVWLDDGGRIVTDSVKPYGVPRTIVHAPAPRMADTRARKPWETRIAHGQRLARLDRLAVDGTGTVDGMGNVRSDADSGL